MQQPGRLRLRPWLEEQIQSGRYPGVSWLDQSARIFQIPWIHAARHGWSIDRDATLFRSWAMHTVMHRFTPRHVTPLLDVVTGATKYSSGRTISQPPGMMGVVRGRYRPGKDNPDPKTWKANFRCALNSLPDICELQEHSKKRGSNAYRVYRMLPSTQTHRRRRGLRLFGRPRERQPSSGDDTHATHAWQPTTRPISDTPAKVEPPAEDTFGSMQMHGTWEAKPEDQEQNEAVFKLMDHLSNTDVWNQTGEQRGWRTNTLWDHWHCAGEDNLYSLHAETCTDLFGPNYIKELSDWSMH